jgi:hypothetical protein
MAEYRAYFLDDEGHIQSAPTLFEADTDAAAIEAATRLLDKHDLDLWQETRHLVRLRHQKAGVAFANEASVEEQ